MYHSKLLSLPVSFQKGICMQITHIFKRNPQLGGTRHYIRLHSNGARAVAKMAATFAVPIGQFL